jgi:hypothetical protein
MKYAGRTAQILLFASSLLLLADAAQASCSRPIIASYPKSFASMRVGPQLRIDEFHHRLAEQTGCTIETPDLPPARSWNDFTRGKVDLFWGLRSAERDQYGAFFGGSPPMYWILIMKPPDPAVPERLHDFLKHPDLRIGLVRSNAVPTDMAEDIEALRHTGQIDESADVSMAITKLEHDRDAAFLSVMPVFKVIDPKTLTVPLREVDQLEYKPIVAGVYMNLHSLNDGDRQALTTGFKILFGSGKAEAP